MLLYHATFGDDRVEKIRKEGLKINQPGNWNDINTEDCVFFAFSPSVAIDYAEAAETYDDSDVVVFSADASDLDLEKVGYDWNNRCEYRNEINSLAYRADVPADVLHEMTAEEIENADELIFSDLECLDEDANEIWGNLLDTFEYEVETNMENIE